MDIFKLEKFKKIIISIPGFGVKSFDKMIKAIENAKTIKMSSLIASLGIKNVGFGSAKRLEKYFNSDINTFLKATEFYHNFMVIEDFGETTALSIYSYFQDKDNMEQFRELLQIVNIVREEENQKVNGTDSPLTGKKLYCTGTFVNHKKNELKAIVEGLGAEFTSGYAKSLDYLVVGSVKGSSKEDKARKDGVKILQENKFFRMIGR